MKKLWFSQSNMEEQDLKKNNLSEHAKYISQVIKLG